MFTLDEYHNTSLIPTPNQFVKLCFREEDNTERAWVIVKTIVNNQLTGIVNNDLVLMTSVKCDDEISFELKHIIDILTEND